MPKTKYTSYSATTPEGIKKLREGANARRKAFVAGKSGGKASSSTKKTSKHGPRERSNSIGGKAKTVASTAASTTAKDPELSGRIKTTFKKGMTQAQRRKAQVANQKRVHAKRKAHKASEAKAKSEKNTKAILADRSKMNKRTPDKYSLKLNFGKKRKKTTPKKTTPKKQASTEPKKNEKLAKFGEQLRNFGDTGGGPKRSTISRTQF